MEKEYQKRRQACWARLGSRVGLKRAVDSQRVELMERQRDAQPASSPAWPRARRRRRRWRRPVIRGSSTACAAALRSLHRSAPCPPPAAALHVGVDASSPVKHRPSWLGTLELERGRSAHLSRRAPLKAPDVSRALDARQPTTPTTPTPAGARRSVAHRAPAAAALFAPAGPPAPRRLAAPRDLRRRTRRSCPRKHRTQRRASPHHHPPTRAEGPQSALLPPAALLCARRRILPWMRSRQHTLSSRARPCCPRPVATQPRE